MATVEEAPAQQQPSPAPAAACPSCGAATAPDQLVCVECGTPTGIGFRRPPSWKLPAVLAGLLLALAGLAAGFVVAEVVQDARSDEKPATTTSAATPPRPTPAPATPTPGDPPPPATKSPGTAPPPASGTDEPGTGGVRSWPAGKSAFTIVLVSADERSEADRRARDAVEKGIPAGVLRSDDYEDLKPGFFVVFAGDFANQKDAEKRIGSYARKGFRGGYPRFIDASNRQAGD